MNKCRKIRLLVASAAALFGLGCAPSTPVQTVRIDGSSTVYPVTEAAAEEFQISKRARVRVTLGISGTGGGFKRFCRGETDISNASRPISKQEMEACKAAGIAYLEMPIAFDALTVVINPKNTWARTLTVAELKKMWEPAAQGKITHWDQINPAWPKQPLTLFGAGADSGTFEYFTEAVVGKSKASRGDFTASEDDNVLVQGVSRDVNGLGYFGFAYYIENQDKLAAAAIVPAPGKPGVAPSVDTVMSGTYRPLARPIFIYVNAKSAQRPEVKDFLEFYNRQAAELVKEVKYIPLPPSAYADNIETLNKLRTGTKFDGENKVGLTIDELVKLEAKD